MPVDAVVLLAECRQYLIGGGVLGSVHQEIVFSNDSSIPYAHYHNNSMPVGISCGYNVLVFLMGEFHKLLLHDASDGFYLISDDSRFFKFKIGGCLFHLSFKVLYYLCIFSLEE